MPIPSSKNLDNLLPWVLRFELRLARFEYTVHHVPVKLLYTAATLSQAPIAKDTVSLSLQQKVESFIQGVTSSLPASSTRLETYKTAQDANPKVKEYCLSRWPSQKEIHPELMPYWKARSSLSLQENLLLYNSQIVVPAALQKETLDKIHAGHQGTERCCLRVKTTVWWPSMTREIEEMIR